MRATPTLTAGATATPSPATSPPVPTATPIAVGDRTASVILDVQRID